MKSPAVPFRPSRCLLALAPVLPLLTLALPAPAATNAIESAKTLATVEVKAQAVSPSPQLQQNTVTANQIEQQQISNLADIVRQQPGVSLSEMGRFGSSGFNIRGVEGDRVKIAIDGMPLGETLDPASNAPYDFFRSGLGGIDPDALKQVTILKGADAITAGSGALGGAVLLQTKDAADYLSDSGDDGALRFKSAYSGNNREWLHSVTGAARVGHLETLLVYSSRDGHEIESFDGRNNSTGGGRTAADPQSAQSKNLLLKLRYQFLPDQIISYSYDQYQSDSLLQNISRQDQLYLQRQGIDDTGREKHSVSYERLIPTAWFDSLQLRFDDQHNVNHGITRMLVTAPCPQNVTPCRREEDRNFVQDNTQLTAAFDKEIAGDGLLQQLTYGLQLQNKQVQTLALDRRYVGNSNTLATLEVDPAFVPLTDVKTRSLYLRDSLQWQQSAWSAVLGARYDQIDYQPQLSATYQDRTQSVKPVDFAAASAQAQLHYAIDDNSRLSLQIGRGFRAPTVENMYLATTTTTLQEVASGNSVILPTSIANPNLKPEYSLNTELAYSLQLGRSQHKIALFRDRYSDMISSSTFTLNPTTAYQSCSRGVCTKQQGVLVSTVGNIDEATVQGLELSGHWDAGASWHLNWSASYQQGDEGNGRPLNSVMPWSAALGVGYQVNDAIRLLLNNRYQASKDASDTYKVNSDGSISSASYLSNSALISDLSLQWQLYPQLQLTAGLFNLLDQDYYRWEKVRFVTAYVGSGVRGGVSGDGIRRYLEPGRYGKISLTLSF
jgi:hemoglobin/transferrin/lactoferrin receptor protein